ncbi:hypothetical protein D3C75_1077960 [compost metagenome]
MYRTNCNLQILGCTFTDHEFIFGFDKLDYCFVELVPCNFNRRGGDYVAHREDCNVSRSAADIHDHIAARLKNIHACTDRCRFRLFF